MAWTRTAGTRSSATTSPPAGRAWSTGHADATTTYDDADATSGSLQGPSPDHRTAIVLRYYAHLTGMSSVGPGDSMDYRGLSDAQVRADATIQVERGGTIWVFGDGRRISTLAGLPSDRP